MNSKTKIVTLAAITTLSLNMVGCQKEKVLNNIDTTKVEKTNEIKYSKEDFQNEYREYLKYLTFLTHEIPSDTYTILGYNYTKTKYSEFKQTQLISFDKVKELSDFAKKSKVKEIRNLSKKLLTASENAQYQLVELANKQEIIETVDEITPIINEYTKVLTEELAKLEFETVKPLLEKNEATEIKKQVKKDKSKMFKEERDRYIDKLEYLYGEKTKKILNSVYDNL